MQWLVAGSLNGAEREPQPRSEIKSGLIRAEQAYVQVCFAATSPLRVPVYQRHGCVHVLYMFTPYLFGCWTRALSFSAVPMPEPMYACTAVVVLQELSGVASSINSFLLISIKNK